VTAAKPPATGPNPATPPRVASIRASVITTPETGHRPHRDTVIVGWLASEGWFCTTCEGSKPCAHVTAVLAAITPPRTRGEVTA
jgi:hypothetical protein